MFGEKWINVISVVKGETKRKTQLINFLCGNNNEGQAGYYKNLISRQKKKVELLVQ